jgi:hypothetical protein
MLVDRSGQFGWGRSGRSSRSVILLLTFDSTVILGSGSEGIIENIFLSHGSDWVVRLKVTWTQCGFVYHILVRLCYEVFGIPDLTIFRIIRHISLVFLVLLDSYIQRKFAMNSFRFLEH